MKHERIADPKQVCSPVEEEFKNQLDAPGFNNIYVMTISSRRTGELGVTKYSLFKPFALDLTLGDPRIGSGPLARRRGLFPCLLCRPLFRGDALRPYPELKNALRLLADRLDEQTMRSLNYEVDSKLNSAAIPSWETASSALLFTHKRHAAYNPPVPAG
ncbi:MAG: hypothetical protein GX335_03160 [Firmicutes bacterium]|nr:hypothetical protein [Bacillota bacterium]